MFCQKCGKEIENDAVVCVHCGCPTSNFEKKKEEDKNQPIIINNNNSASSAAAASAASNNGKVLRKHSILFDLFMILITGGLWIIWMIVRPKYY